MNLYQHKEDDTTIVDLLPPTVTNKYGNTLFWIRLENGNTVSIWENEFKKLFHPR